MELSYRQDFQQGEQSAWFVKEELQRFKRCQVSTLRTLCCVWSGHSCNMDVLFGPFIARNITKLERVQRRTAKFILKTEDDYDVRISRLDSLYRL